MTDTLTAPIGSEPERAPEESSPPPEKRRGLSPEGRPSAVHGIWLSVLAYLVALGGTLLLHDPAARWGGVLLLLIGGAVGVAAWRGYRWSAPFGSVSRRFIPGKIGARNIVSLAGIAVAGAMSWLASARWSESRTEPFGLAGWLWLLSMALLVASAAVWPRHQEVEAGETTLVVRKAKSSGVSPGGTPWTAWEAAGIAGIVILALALRLWNLGEHPFEIHPDEILTASNAVGAFGSGQQVSVFSTIWYGINLPTLWFAPVFAATETGGYTLASLRLPAALFGALTVIPLYGLIRGTWGRAAAVAGSLVMAVSISNVHFSRVTLNNIVTQFFWVACFYFLIKGLQTRHPLYWVLAGIMGGLSEHFYYGTRLLFLLLIAFGIYLLVIHWRQGWRYLGHMALLALGFVVGFGPLLAYFLNTPGLYFGRGAGVITWNRIPTSWDDLALMWNTLWPLIEQNLLSISTIPGSDSLYFAPLLLPAEAALFALGVVLLAWKWRHPAAFLTLLSGLAVLFVGGTLVPGPGNINHWTPAFPSFYVAIGVPVGAWVASRGWSVLPGRWRPALPVALALGLATIAVLNVDYYFNKYGTFRPEFEVRARQSRYQAALGTGYIVLNVGPTWQPYDPETNRYLIKGQEGAQLLNPESDLPVPNRDGKGLAFFFFPDNEQYLPLVRSLYPGGVEEQVNSHIDTPLFKVYKLTPEQALKTYGARLVVSAAETRGGGWQGNVSNFGALPEGLAYPVRARWSGRLFVESFEEYRLLMNGLPNATLVLNGQPMTASQGLMLQRGWHSLVVEAELASAPPRPSLQWSVSGGAFVDVPAGQAWPAE